MPIAGKFRWWKYVLLLYFSEYFVDFLSVVIIVSKEEKCNITVLTELLDKCSVTHAVYSTIAIGWTIA